MVERENAVRRLIAQQLQETSKPCVACSFGKDSVVLLHFVREQMPDIPVLYCPHFDDPDKHAYVAQMVQEWNLNIQPILPSFRAIYELDEWIELVDVVEPAPGQHLWLAIDPDRSAPPDESPICGMDAMQKVTPQEPRDFDAIFIGQKQQDFDRLLPWPAFVPIVHANKTVRYIYPLAEWTDLHVWESIYRHRIPYNQRRYDKHLRSANNDTWNICTMCMGTNNPVHCPKVNAEIPGVRFLLDIDERTAQFARLTQGKS